MRRDLLIVLAIGSAGAAFQPARAQIFEVASVKPRGSEQPADGHTLATNTTLKTLVGYAYGVNGHQISGGPSWQDSDVFSIEATPESGTVQPGPGGHGEVLVMLQALLADRFKLSLRREIKEQPIYNLVIAKGGHKVKETATSTIDQNLDGGRGQLVARGAPMSALAASLSHQLERSVVDKTGLSGRYDFSLTYAQEAREGVFGRLVAPQGEASSDPNDRSVFTSLQEQLGLRLESAKGPVQMLVIERAEKPGAN